MNKVTLKVLRKSQLSIIRNKGGFHKPDPPAQKPYVRNNRVTTFNYNDMNIYI